jgi:hypothetical protein
VAKKNEPINGLMQVDDESQSCSWCEHRHGCWLYETAQCIDLNCANFEQEERERWHKVLDLPGSHRYFRDMTGMHRIAIADRSGRYPENTEDGILWLDTKSDIVIHSDTPILGSVSIPLFKDSNGERTWTGDNFANARRVAELFKMRIVRMPLDGTQRFLVNYSEVTL